MITSKGKTIDVIFDGACPFCSAFVTKAALQSKGYAINLIDARQSPAAVEEAKQQGYNLHDEMLVRHGTRVYAGAEATIYLARLAQPKGHQPIFAALNNKRLALLLYPILMRLRKLYLTVLKVPPID